MEINMGMVPPGGSHYPVAEGVVLKSHSFEQLYKLIAEYRLRQGLDPGDPVKDVADYVCSRWPHACRLTAQDGAPVQFRGRSLGGRVAAWAAIMVRNQPTGGYPMVAEDVANARAAKCAMCPHNKQWVGCSNCVRSALSMLLQLRHLRRLNLDNSLLGCEVCGHDNATAVHIQNYKVDDATKAGLPQCCWIDKQ